MPVEILKNKSLNSGPEKSGYSFKVQLNLKFGFVLANDDIVLIYSDKGMH